jgi:YidC/Oxa1 family membrane protein insertase
VGLIGGLLSPIEDPLEDLLVWIHETIGLSWGWAIVVVVVLVRVLLVPLAVKQIRSMQRLQRYAPQLKALQKKYKGDKQKLNEEVMKFYREKKVNPAASCLPILPQIPIFIALFFVLREFDEDVIKPRFPDSDLSFVRIVPDITADLLAHWSGVLLLVIYVISQLASGLLALRATPATDARQARLQKIMFMVLPFVIIPFAIRFPVGLMIYWVTTNLWTAGQGITTRRFIPRPDYGEAPPKRSSRTAAASDEDDEDDDFDEAEDEAAAEKQRKKDKAAKAKAKSMAMAATKSGSAPKKRRDPSAAKSGTPSGQVKRRKKKGGRPR